MSKRNRENTNGSNLSPYTKRAKKELLGAIIATIANEMNLNEKLAAIAAKPDSHIQETKMDCELIEHNKIDNTEVNKKLSTNLSFKFNGICDRDRRRHMYF